jgi:hypothetical protein
MVTNKQHDEIWEKVRRMRFSGLTVFADGLEIEAYEIKRRT